jgi:glutamate synthase domain-containing protein 2/glutamate synthase domain-containing protein 1/glutamate synthase domain-containing protein 3
MRAAFGLYHPRYEHDACGVGFIANLRGEKSHRLVQDAVRILINLEHRGAVGADQKTGDGAGILLQLPHDFFRRVAGVALPRAGLYAAGFFFLPPGQVEADRARVLVERMLREQGAGLLSWRQVPVNPDCLGEQARREMPSFWQLFLTPQPGTEPGEPTERRLYVLRRCLEKEAQAAGWGPERFYVPSLSSRTIVYKGMFVSPQFLPFYPDLSDADFESALAIVHQRYSTNTSPSWFLAQPFRFAAHNGEINTLRRNVNNMRARETSLASPLFGEDLARLLPVVAPSGSDSAVFDNVLELLTLGGRSLPHAMAMMVPEAFGTRYHISEDKRAFFEYHAAIMEPWDGPAAMAFSDGRLVGALLDRNGLRPARYLVTRGGTVLLASEVGVLEIDPAEVLEKGRLAPGQMLLVDTAQGRMIRDHEVKSSLSRRRPYRHWLEKNRLVLKGLFGVPRPVALDRERLPALQRCFGYTREDLLTVLAPMAENAQEPIGSMGDDTPPAVLSARPRLLFDYFRQLFAQVTNPPIDPYRENLVMSLMSFVGRERNLLAETPEHCRQLKLSHPILTNDDIEQLRESGIKDFPVRSVPILFPAAEGRGTLSRALAEACLQTERLIDEGASLIILSDRGAGPERAAIPSLLAIGGIHQHLVRRGKRHLCALVIETGEAREVHHFACLIGFGASGVNPYLAFETIRDLQDRGHLPAGLSAQAAAENYITAVKKGLAKIMSKMGISTLRSYRGSQCFEALGLGPELIQLAFAGASSRIGGIGLQQVEREKLALHESGFGLEPTAAAPDPELPSGGLYHHRRGGERHLFSAEAVALLQRAVRENSYERFCEYTALVNGDRANPCTLRALLRIRPGAAVPVEEVEAEQAILKRFVTSAMSFGSISKEAHETLAEAMNLLGCRSNSGEGGEEEARLQPVGGTDHASRIKQVASARFGVTSAYLASAEELQIKMAQGAKPGEGGQLPGLKVDEAIARVRHSTPGIMLISPPPHHDVYSIEDLAQLIFDLKHANPQARVSVKLVSEAGVGTVATGVAKGRADTVLISGGDGGTGAAPLTSIRHAGLPWELGLAEAQQVLSASGLRGEVRLAVDGQLKTGRDVLIAALLGAEEFGFATTALVSLGCVLARKCHLNTCPTGVATQDPRLRERFAGKPAQVVNFMRFLAREVRELMAEHGFRSFEEMVGMVERLEPDPEAGNEKTRSLDFSALLAVPAGARRCARREVNTLPPSLDTYLIDSARDALERREPMEIDAPIRNCDRAVGTALSSEISRRHGSRGLPEGTLHIRFKGSAGQSFGAFLAPGITCELEGEANDYLGKGLSGGRLVVYPPRGSSFIPERNMIIGNVALFGATSGEAFINGLAGERFAVRNSGALAVVEGVGDHGCEYMTGGRVVVLGETGINFAAGMSGGIAYVLDRTQLFDTRCNLEMVDVEALAPEDREFLRAVLEKHVRMTGSPNAAAILTGWEEMLPLFVKVVPLDYRSALRRLRENELKESETVKMTEEVFS